MAFRFIIISAVAAITRASDRSFSLYGINNPILGTIKSRYERQISNSVIGQYLTDSSIFASDTPKGRHESQITNSFIGQYSSIFDTDRLKRIVDYELNPPNGFNALRKDPADELETSSAITNSIDGIENSLVDSTVPLTVSAIPTTAQVGSLANLIRSYPGGFPPKENFGLASNVISFGNYNRYPGPIHSSRYTGIGYFGFGADRFGGAVGK